MGKLAQTTNKYTIYAHFEADGTVEKPDIIGAVFGQTEGLLGSELDLRELQQTGRIGRVDVDIQMRNGKANGTIIIPSSLDASETAIIAAAVETIERIGPCNARVGIEKVEDVRIEKRRYVVDRAKEILSRISEEVPETAEITEEIKESVRVASVVNYNGMPAGPQVATADAIIICEGRADVVNLLRCGMKNVVAIEGTSVPPQLARLAREKETTAFLDGDRGGDLILKELMAVSDIDFVARAPTGQEVEELTKKEIFKALRERIPADKAMTDMIAKGVKPSTEEKILQHENDHLKPAEISEPTEPEAEQDVPEVRPRQRKKKLDIESEKASAFKTMMENLTGTRAAYLLNESNEPLAKVPLREVFNALKELPTAALLVDGEVDQKLANFAANRGVKFVVGTKAMPRMRLPEGIIVAAVGDL